VFISGIGSTSTGLFLSGTENAIDYIYIKLNAMRSLLSIILFLLVNSVIAQKDDSWMVYDDSQLTTIDISIPADTLIWVLQHTSSDLDHLSVVHIKNSWIDTTLASVGFRLKGNTSRDAQKKSFKLAFDAFVPGRKFFDIASMNLNGEHNDPSIIRSKLCFDLMKDIGLKASRASHVKVYINGTYFGLYVSVEHVDNEYLKKNYADPSGNLWKCLYPADLTYKGTDPELYRGINNNGRPAYELKTNEQAADFRQLARFISIINNTGIGSLPDSLENIANPYEFLKYFAINNLVGSWDEYWSLMNNYYLYFEPAENKIHLIPFDYDNSFGVDWFSVDWARSNPYVRQMVSSGPRPLANKMMLVNAYRDLYTHFLSFYSEHVYALPQWETRLDDLMNLISTAALEDNYRTYDYGFTDDDFINSFTAESYSNQHVKYGIRQFVNARNSSLSAQLNYKNAEPIIYLADFYPKNPRASDPVKVVASCFSNTGISDVHIEFQRDGSDEVESYALEPKPVNSTKKVEEEDRWEGNIPSLGEGGGGTFRLLITDEDSRSVYFPRSGFYSIHAVPTFANHLVINEFMAANSSYLADPSGEFDDWIELYNPTNSVVPLTGLYLSDSRKNLKKWRFTQEGLSLNPGQFLTVWCDNDSLQSGIHSNFKLSAGGEFIGLTAGDGHTIIDSISFGLQAVDFSYGRFPDGSVYLGTMSPSQMAFNTTTGTGQGKILDLLSWAVYPNPFRNELNLSIAHAGIEPVVIKIYDLLGRMVYTNQYGNNTRAGGDYQISTTSLAPGTYSIVLINGDRKYVKKLIRLR
jgi:hypothetical protein